MSLNLNNTFLNVQGSDKIEEKILANGHELKEEVYDTPEQEVITVTEEGIDSKNSSTVDEVT